MLLRIALALTVVAGQGCDDRSIAPTERSRLPLRMGLFQHSYWVGGFDRPLFLAYSDGTVLFPHRYEMGIPMQYRIAHVAAEELDRALADLGLNEAVKSMDSLYDFAPMVTDQHSFYLAFAADFGMKLVTIRAGLRDSFYLRPEVPGPFRYLYERLRQYAPSESRPWVPDSIEVSVWPYEYAPDDPPLAWPPNWPGLDDSRWQRRPDEFVEEVRTIRLPFTNVGSLDSLLDARRTKQAIGISGKKWALGYRWIFPDEDAWSWLGKRLEY